MESPHFKKGAYGGDRRRGPAQWSQPPSPSAEQPFALGSLSRDVTQPHACLPSFPGPSRACAEATSKLQNPSDNLRALALVPAPFYARRPRPFALEPALSYQKVGHSHPCLSPYSCGPAEARQRALGALDHLPAQPLPAAFLQPLHPTADGRRQQRDAAFRHQLQLSSSPALAIPYRSKIPSHPRRLFCSNETGSWPATSRSKSCSFWNAQDRESAIPGSGAAVVAEPLRHTLGGPSIPAPQSPPPVLRTCGHCGRDFAIVRVTSVRLTFAVTT